MNAINEMNGYEHDGRVLTVRLDQSSQNNSRPRVRGRGGGASGGNGGGSAAVAGGGGGKNGYDRSEKKGPVKETKPRNYAATVYCGNLPWGVTWQQLKDIFAAQGLPPEYADVKIGYDGRSRGWGTVRFADMETAQRAAKEMNGFSLDGRRLDIHMDHGPRRNGKNNSSRGGGIGDSEKFTYVDRGEGNPVAST